MLGKAGPMRKIDSVKPKEGCARLPGPRLYLHLPIDRVLASSDKGLAGGQFAQQLDQSDLRRQ